MPVRHDHWIAGKATPQRAAPTCPRSTRPRAVPATRSPPARRPTSSGRSSRRGRAQPAWARCVGRGALRGAPRGRRRHRARADELIGARAGLHRQAPRPAPARGRHVGVYFRYYAGIVRAHRGRTIDLGAGHHTYTRLEPYGVVAVITPWNLPLNQACRAAGPGARRRQRGRRQAVGADVDLHAPPRPPGHRGRAPRRPAQRRHRAPVPTSARRSPPTRPCGASPSPARSPPAASWPPLAADRLVPADARARRQVAARRVRRRRPRAGGGRGGRARSRFERRPGLLGHHPAAGRGLRPRRGRRPGWSRPSTGSSPASTSGR